MTLLTEILAQILSDCEVGIYDANGDAGDIYVETMPDINKDYLIGIYQYGGRQRELPMYGDTRHYSIQINVKHKNKYNSMIKINEIIGAINYKEFRKEGFYLHDIDMNQEPFILKIDKDNKYIATVNFTISCTINK